MSQAYLFRHGGLTVDLSKVKSLHVDPYIPRGKSNILKIEYLTRVDFIFNPETKEYERIEIRDFIEHPYADYETAIAYRDEWQEYWQKYLDTVN